MYGESEGPEYGPGLKDRVVAAATAPALLWQAAVVAAVLAVVIILTGVAVSSRVARLDSKLDTVATALSELDKRVQKLDGKIEAVRTAVSALPSVQPAKPQQQTPQQQQAPAPGQIVPKRKPQ